MPDRGIAPVIGIVLIVGLTALLGTAVGVMATGIGPTDPPPEVRFTGEYDAEQRLITLQHAGGEVIAVDRLRLRVEVDDEPLEHQPPIPFFAARGFESGPSGPINPASDGDWAPGEIARFGIATTNEPIPSTDATVTVIVLVDDLVVAEVKLTP